jgi:hypothetical protein
MWFFQNPDLILSRIQPLMYQAVSIHMSIVLLPAIFRLPLRAVAKLITVNPARVRAHTLHVCFVEMRLADVVVDFLSRCGATVNLAFFDTRLWHPNLLPILGALPLQRLSSTLRSIAQLFPWPNPFDGSHLLFSCITHLDILDWFEPGDEWRTWSGLAQIPQLTHLSTANFMSKSVVQGVLRHCKSLKVLVIIFRSQIRLDECRLRWDFTDDPRYVMLLVADRLLDWEAGARGGEDYWDRASVMVDQRLSSGDEHGR